MFGNITFIKEQHEIHVHYLQRFKEYVTYTSSINCVECATIDHIYSPDGIDAYYFV